MNARPSNGVFDALKILKASEIDCEPIFSKHGLSISTLSPSTPISRTKELAIYQTLHTLIAKDYFGLTLGKGMPLVNEAPLASLVETAETLLEACQIIGDFQRLTYLMGKLEWIIEADQCELRLHTHGLPTDILKLLADRDLTGIMEAIKDLAHSADVEVNIKHVYLPYTAPQTTEPYDAYFGCPITFGHPHGRLVIDRAQLTRPLPKANLTEHQHLAQSCKKLLAEQKYSDQNFSGQVRQFLNLFTYQFPSITDACHHFGMAERTLRRKLSKEGSKFQTLMDDVRLKKAQLWLQEENLPMETIASRLGYAEPAAFNHAFKRWTGCNPSTYRRSLKIV